MIKEKPRDTKKKSSTPNGTNIEGNGTTSSTSESREDDLCDKGSDIKEEPEEQMTDIRESMSTHASPLDEVKSSPPQPCDKDGVSSTMSNSCKPLKSENGDSQADTSFRANDSCENVLPINMQPESLHEGVQPLPSNVMNKQPVTMEAQYMQQQSQIFVFSTSLANKAADAVMQGQFASIIAYHCSQPRTKKYLEGSCQQVPGVQSSCGNNLNLDQSSGKPPHNSHSNMMPGHANSMIRENIIPALGDFSPDMSMGGHQPLTGVKVPDENLTPQQRQHREEQLATLRKMQQILFPEALSGPEDGSAPNVPPSAQSHIEDVMLPENVDVNKSGSSHSDWQKIHIQFYEDPKHKKNRTTGPPPSYQQATRSASVPIAMPSPNPSSPNNTTSNLSLPSPRTCSGINSPADKVNPRIPGPSPTIDSPSAARSTSSNPPTPVSIHLSPKHKDKLSAANEFSPSSSVSAPNSQQSPADSLYCRSVSSGMAPNKPASNPGGKEPNLMPVPSPQQIQYLNAFEGQELTIQKQPNTSLKEQGRKTPPLQPSSLESVPNNNNQCPSNGNGNTTPSNNNGGNNNNGINSVNSELQTKLSGPPTPSTPDIASRGSFTGEVGTPDSGEKQSNQSQRKMEAAFCSSPQNSDRCAMNVPNNFLAKGPSYLETPSKCPINEKDMSNSNYQCMGPANVPLNPNGINVSSASKASHFDPISSLAQMSQQLTNNVPNSPVNHPPMMSNMHQNLVPYNTNPQGSPHLMPMNDMHHLPGTPPEHRLPNPMQQSFNNNTRMACPTNANNGMSVSPKLMQSYGVPPRAMPRGINYNGASVQVKPNAPNTIQYLPSRPQPNAGPRAPPSLDFLQRFSNPLSNLDVKVPTHNLQYFPNTYPQNSMGDMGVCSPHGNIRPPVRVPGNPAMMRLQSPQMPPMGFNNADMYSNPNNCQLFGAATKPGPMGMGAPDASQPLPPSMGQANNFKNSSFIGPTTADPNYAQQFHNFQQQLYATNTRGQLGAQAMNNSQHYFMPK